MNFIRRNHMKIFFILVAMESLAANFAHPITPTLIKELQLPDYAFGVLFAGMAFTNFLFSPLWAKQVKRMGSKKVLGICCIGYGVGQAMFAIMKTLPTILCARLLSGFFVGGIMVSFLTYIIHESSIEQRGKYLALSATFTTVFGAFGYMVGGFVGVKSIVLTFALQSITLMLSGVFFYLCLKDDREQDNQTENALKDANPFQAFIDSSKFMTIMFALLFFVVFLTSTASTAYDQCFNYYIKDQFNFNSSYNGMLKAVVGFISLLANTTICIWILNHTEVRKSIIVILGLGGAFLLGVSFLNEILPFIIMNIMFFAINAIYIPLLQDMCATRSSHKDSDMVMGFYNAMKSLGMITGALFAGFIYAFGAKLSFLFAGIFFLIAMICMFIYYQYTIRKEESVN